eukprot:TRINITY_DN8944_c0_g1_i10.p1 TRINITY_DN8944_c0_g1~~TRINITY_DN8944_c0_g1_i10.p1  ORF type:complete len:1137 (-),score=123.12 TRINITY_DN8944_c0_g1_i10:208-3198(-)
MERCIGDLLAEDDNVHVLCSGDFNARTGSLQTQNLTSVQNISDVFDKSTTFVHSRTSDDLVINDFGKKLLDMCACYNLKLVNGCPELEDSGGFTYLSEQGHSVVDYFLASFDLCGIIEKMVIQNRIESDHMPVELYCRVNDVAIQPTLSSAVKVDKLIWSEDQAATFTMELMSEGFLMQLDYATSLIDTNLEESVNVFTKTFNEAAVSMKKKVMIGGKKKEQPKWFDKECFLKKKEVRRLLRICRKTKAKEDYVEFAKTKKEYKALLDAKERTQKHNDLNSLLSSVQNPNKFWNEIRKYKRKNVVTNNISEDDWIRHFKSVFNEGFVNDESPFSDVMDDIKYDSTLDGEISEREILKAIKKMKNGKAAGNDCVLAEMLKHSQQTILPFLLKYFNAMFSRGYFPLKWSEAIIVPLHKKGDTNIPDNYRGISLLSVLSKVFTHIMNDRLTLWAEQNGIICEAQAGFRKGRSTVDHIFTLNAVIEKHLLKNKKLYVAFIDFKKAYDTVNRNVLWTVLLRAGVQGRMLKMIQAMYSTVRASVLCHSNTGFSRFFECLQGLKQGCIVSPILFSLLINELANEIILSGKHGVTLSANEIELFLLLFADDLTLLSSTTVGLQHQLNILQGETERLHLTVNFDKSKIIVFRKGGFLRMTEKWFLDSRQMEVVNSYKYLGLTFSTRQSFTSAMEEAKLRGKKCTNAIVCTLRKIGCNSPVVFFKLFDMQVVPSLLYASEIWGYKAHHQLEQVHLYACKRFLHVRNKTANDVVYGELGRFPLWITSTTRCIKYWFRLLKQSEDRYSKKAYNMLLSMHEKGHTTWVTRVKTILCDNGFEQVWLFGCGYEAGFIKELKERLFSNFCYNWRNRLDSSARSSLFGNLKHMFAREQYIDVLYVDVYRNILAQFRMGVSQLNVHRYRFSPSNENTACPVCLNTPEDEIHFMFVCPLYDQIRQFYKFNATAEENLVSKLVSSLKIESQREIVNLAKFLVAAFKLRTNFIDSIA